MFIVLILITLYRYGSTSMIFSKSDIETILSENSIQSTYIPNLYLKRNVWNASVCHHLKLNLSNVNYNLCIKILKLSYPGLLNETTPIFLPRRNVSVEINSLHLKKAGGYVMDFEDLSFVKGYIHEGRFYGTIQINSEVYYVEPTINFNRANANPKSGKAVVYKKPHSSFFDEINGTFSFGFEIFNMNIGSNYGRPQKITGKSCLLSVVMDNSFIKAVGGGSIDLAIQKFLLNFDEVNSILRSTDFDNDRIPDNVGVTIGLIAVLDSSDPNLGGITLLPVDTPVNPLEVLQTFAALSITRHACLNILLLGHPFIEQYLGVSFTATKNIFDRFGNGDMLPQPLVDVNLVHEIAHSFGSDHDSHDCLKGYIMSPKTAIPATLINFQFSPCSKRDISAVLRKQGDCLLDFVKPFCGNQIVETGEECDCGSSYHCSIKDPCCYPRDSTQQCKVNRNTYECHPSEDLCCTSTCQYKNLTHVGLNCTNLRNKCPCPGKECTCGMFGTCIGDECHSFECTRLGLKECHCPIDEMSEFCETCCMDANGACFNSRIISDILIKSNQSFTLRTQVSFVDTTIREVETICNDVSCFHLNFQQFPINSFCAYQGKVGICVKARCTLPPYVPNRLPALREPTSTDCGCTLEHLNAWIILILINIIIT
ncbi:adam10/adam17 metallopeptidase family member [Holotrichia oblita]|uniref:Adam10/adam17 metallopeptidase family member n=1 Tax=Holotrichia oblita TaxID=644536 RepID=A0ACB9TRG2_HOLOL|nr:adam10/adam17 metallopeptidase family member [Holotrichia oblita]